MRFTLGDSWAISVWELKIKGLKERHDELTNFHQDLIKQRDQRDAAVKEFKAKL